MIEQCLSNKNENAIVSKFKKFLDLNKPLSSIICCQMVRWKKERKWKRKRKGEDMVGSFAGKESSKRPKKWN